MLPQFLASLGEAGFGDRQALANFDRRRVVIYADKVEFHETNL
jgi:hypothetical protein